MKKQFLFFTFFLLGLFIQLKAQAQSSDPWKQIDSLLKIQLVKSAEQEIDQLYANSLVSENYSDFIEALHYKSQLPVYQQTPNDFTNFLKLEIENAKFPFQQILHSFLANFYHQYYQNHRWKINQKTHVQEAISEDLENWSKENFLEQSEYHFAASLQHQDSLYQIKIDAFEPILTNRGTAKNNYPTLFDLLANRALKFFTSYAEVSRAKLDVYLISTNEFLSKEIENNDQDYWQQAIELYQSIVLSHSQNRDTIALVRSELNRLQWLYKQNDQGFLKKYLELLTHMADVNAAFEISAEIQYEMARVHANEGLKYHAYRSPEYQWENKKAVEICEQVIRKYPESEGGKACKELIRNIKNPSLSLQLKEIVLPKQPILASLTYSNIEQLHFRVIKLSHLDDQDAGNQKELEKYLSHKPIINWKRKLISEGDFQSHNMQIRVPELNLGSYVLLASPDPEFHLDSLIQINKFHASEISFIKRDDATGAIDVFVLSRKTGHPMEGVKLTIQSNNYDYQRRKVNWKNVKSLITPSNGYLRITDLIANQSFRFIFSKDKDTIVEKRIYNRGKLSESEKKTETQIFTDRSIYRPGQTVYFKGVVYEKHGSDFKVAPDRETEVRFFDANRQKIGSLNKTTNEFGSFDGSFIIPQNSLNGQMQIRTGNGSIWISVEEYKRPSFEIKMDTLKKQFRLKDDIEITGKAIAYAGNPLTNAKGKFSVTRTYSPLYYWFFDPVYSEQKQISHGEFQTDEEGNFTFKFIAKPDEKINPKQHPSFNFLIEIELSDLNGETQKTEQNIRLAYVDLKLNSEIAEVVDKEGLGFIPISAINLNDLEQEVNVSVSIFKLETPDRAFKQRSWQRPDYFNTDKETFYTYFPNDQFDNESDFETWEIDHQIFQAEINTSEVEGVQLYDIKDWLSGKYKIRFTARDYFDEEVVVEKYFTLFSSSNPQMPYPQIEFFKLEQNELNIGDTLRFTLGSGNKNVKALYEIHHKNKVFKSKWLELNNSKQQVKFPIRGDLKDGLNLNVLFVFDNKIYSQEEEIKINDPYRKLDIQLQTFRPILKPGGKEEWSIYISEHYKNPLNAELLCSMWDASLDQLKPHSWNFPLANHFYNRISWNTHIGFDNSYPRKYNQSFSSIRQSPLGMPELRFYWEVMGTRMYMGRSTVNILKDDLILGEEEGEMIIPDEVVTVPKMKEGGMEQVQVRKNFNETVFFYPDLKTDSQGNISIKFTSPEVLSRWKFMALAHTKDLRIAQLTQEVIMQKELMVSPNLPRFFREGDTIYFSTKISSLVDKALSGEVSLELMDAQNMKIIPDIFQEEKSKHFSLAAKASIQKQWKLVIPYGIKAITYRLMAKSQNHSDGEERSIPVLPNRMLVTESLPIHLNPKEQKKLTLDKLLRSDSIVGLKQHRLKLEMTSNPVWYAIQALPYVDHDHHENAISLFIGFYANAMASRILNSNPKIKQVFEQWKNLEPEALLSNLEKNQELKNILLNETPWLEEAKKESEQKKLLVLFFNENNINQKLESSFKKLLELQLSNGSWTWFKGMRESRYITQFVLDGLLELKSNSSLSGEFKDRSDKAIKKAIAYLNKELIDDYRELKNTKNINLDEPHLSNNQIQHLYILSRDEKLNGNSEEFEIAKAYYLSQIQKYWPFKSNYLQAMVALILHRYGDAETANLILKSLRERAQIDEEMGMFWISLQNYYWHQAPIESQAMIIKAFDEISENDKEVNQLKKWLLKQKQTQRWLTPKASVEAINAVLQGDDELFDEEVAPIEVKVAHRTVQMESMEAGISYETKSWNSSQIKATMGQLGFKNPNSKMAWGAMHWQYFLPMDSVTSSTGNLHVEKELFVKIKDENGDRLIPIHDRELKIGDRLVSRMIIKIDRMMEFVHLKDMRASGLEPLMVLSGYRFEGGIGFYKSNTDAATHYYFDRLRPGTYVLENEFFVTQKGSFSNGISSIQCLYAPEFNSHSQVTHVEVKE